MNNRQITLYAYLANDAKTPRTAAELGQHLNCCEKTVRTDIAHINDWLSRNAMHGHIAGARGRGFTLDQPELDIQRSLSELALATPSSQPHVDLFVHGMTELLLTRHSHTIASLANALFCSTFVLKRELARWESMLATCDVALIRGRRIRIEGRELNIRWFLVNYLFLMAPDATHRTIVPHLIGTRGPAIDQVIHLLVPESLRGSANAREQLRLYVAIAIIRNRMGFPIDQGATMHPKDHLPHPALAADIAMEPDATPYSEQECARLLRQADALLGHALDESEYRFLLTCDKSMAAQWTPEFAHRFTPRNAHTQLMANTLMDDLALKGAHVPFPCDVYLASIIDTAIGRALEGSPIIDLDGNAVKTHCFNEHIVLMQTILDSPLWNEVPLWPDDYTRITMLLAPYLGVPARPPLPRAVLVINAGVAVAMYVKTQLVRTFGQAFHIKRLITESEIDSLDAASYDFLISLGYLQTNVPYVRISSTVNKEDCEHIMRFLAMFRAKRHQLLSGGDTHDVQSLQARSQQDVVAELYAWASGHGVWDGTAAEHTRALATCCLTHETQFIAAVSCHHVLRTTWQSFALDRLLFFRGTEITHVHILWLCPHDDQAYRFSALYGFKRAAGLPL